MRQLLTILFAVFVLSACGVLFPDPFMLPPPEVPGEAGSSAVVPIRGALPGYGYAFGSCEGNRAEGKAWITFYYHHRLAPQSVHIGSGDSYAMDMYGNRYPISVRNSWRDTRAGVTEKVVFEVRGIPPGVTGFSIVCLPFSASTIGVAGIRDTVLEMRGIPIAWTLSSPVP